MIQSQKKYRKTDIQTSLHINSPQYRRSVYAPQQNRRESVLFIGTQFSNLYTTVNTPAKGRVGDTLTRRVKVRVSADVRVGEPGSNCRDVITCFFVRKVIDLAFEKNLMRPG